MTNGTPSIEDKRIMSSITVSKKVRKNMIGPSKIWLDIPRTWNVSRKSRNLLLLKPSRQKPRLITRLLNRTTM
jgi:hypothetical protein